MLISERLRGGTLPACGQRHMQGKIMGGVDTLEKKWPWQVSVHYAGFHICGGSIIDEYWILSAAHCFDRNKITEAFDIYVGLVDLRVAGSHTQWFEVNKVIIHPTYKVYHPVGGDIALVQLKTRIVFSDSVLPICIAPPDVTLSNLSCWATGWGSISQQGDTSDKLQEVQLPLIPLRLCQLLYGHTSYILSDMLCAGDLRDMKTACEVECLLLWSHSPASPYAEELCPRKAPVRSKACTLSPSGSFIGGKVEAAITWTLHQAQGSQVPAQRPGSREAAAGSEHM
ncbi:serine protease 38 [Balaenoptera acutorostrata]|uniref:Serine protease 38 n=1 Tax=Balaenoptera acutorostrata TaxID=9767 RepID=A0ABM3T2T1_BALAC|nr:serine protease 38 [Balaenoptera acutorostrata]